MDARQKRVDLILQQLEELPTLPAVALRVLEVTSSDTSSAKEVVDLISADPGLSLRILQLTSRADVGVRDSQMTIQRAVVLLGFEAVRSAVLGISVFQTFNTPRDGEKQAGTASQFNRVEFWVHCVAVACCAEMLAELKPAVTDKSSRPNSPSEAFLCGLLHDLGKVALDAVLPKSFSRVVEAVELLRGNIADVERAAIGIDHLVVGKRISERWQLPAVIRDCTWLHGQPPEALPAGECNVRMVNLVSLADHIVRERHLGYSGNYLFSVSRDALLNALGLTGAQVDAVLPKLVDRIEVRAKALGLDRSSADELYQDALAQANRELGHVSSQLAVKNQKLTARSQFFATLSQFQSAVNSEATPQLVLRAIAQTGVGMLGAEPVAAFSISPRQDYAECVICDGTGRVIDSSLVDLPSAQRTIGRNTKRASSAGTTECSDSSRPSKPASGHGPVIPVGADLEWITSTISPRLAHDKRFWICLEAEGVCVGGVVWGATAGESERLGSQVQELSAMAGGWATALRTAQVSEEARTLAEQLAEANRRLHDAHGELLRSKAMLSVGEMAAGAAHEMNNPLAIISGRSQLMSQQLVEPRQKAAAHLIYEQSHRLSSIITELMDFARPEPPSPRECDLADLVQRALHEAKMHNDPADRTIEVTMGDVPLVQVDERQVSAAMTEVLDNALHVTDSKHGHIAIHVAHDVYWSRVVVTITDDGCGMDEGTAKRAFDPFFSNKPAGRRRGLGLAKALRWIESSGGSIRLESQVGKGTRAVILLPAVAPAESAPVMSKVEALSAAPILRRAAQ